jgi:hypothetical protein
MVRFRTNQGPGYDPHRSGKPSLVKLKKTNNQCLMASINKDAKEVVALRESVHRQRYSGILFKIIITEAQVDTKSTTTLMWQKLSAGLPDMMAECGSNVKAFQEVRSIQRDRRGQMLRQFSPVAIRLFWMHATEGRKVLSHMEQLENAPPMGPSSLTLRSSCPRPRTSTLNSLRTNSPAAARREDDSRCSPDRARSPQGILHKVPERRRRKPPRREGGRPSGDSYPTKWTSVPPRKGNRSPRRLAERIITGASETMLTSPSGFVMNLQVQWT